MSDAQPEEPRSDADGAAAAAADDAAATTPLSPTEAFAFVTEVRDYAIYMIGPSGRILTWNEGARTIKGYTAEQIIGQSFARFFTEDDRAEGKPARLLARAAAEGRVRSEGWRVRRDGTRFWADLVLTAVRDPEGRLRGFVKVTRDLTERRRMEEQAGRERLRADETQLALEQRDEFISLASHELRTPLAALVLKVQGITRALEDAAGGDGRADVTPKLLDRLHGALRQIERLTDLVERLLDVSRIVQGKLAMVPVRLDLAELAGRLVEAQRETALRVGTALRYQACGDATGTWDPKRLEQAIANVVSNAIKYGNGKPVEIAVQATDSHVRLLVTDHGIGIAPHDMERIFTRFQRAAPVQHYGGLGLGLYITRSIIEAHQGTIHVSSHPSEGTTFMIELPRHPPPADAVARPEPSP